MQATTQTVDLNKMSLAALTNAYNAAVAKPIKKFSCSREMAIVKIKQAQASHKSAAKSATVKAAPKGKAVKATATKKLGIGKYVMELLKAGKLSPQEILNKVQVTFPGCKTTVKCVFWYKSKMTTA